MVSFAATHRLVLSTEILPQLAGALARPSARPL